jgi:hypothetical protein
MIECRQAELDSLFHQYAGESEIAVAPMVTVHKDELTLADHEVLDKIGRSKQALKFNDLFNGIWKGKYESQSEADLAFCCMLAFWCKKDPVQVDNIFCQSRLFRPKWDEKHGKLTYGEMTIQKAIDRTEKVYGEHQESTKKVYSTPIFQLMQAGMIKAKPTQWLIRDLIEHDSLDLVFGDPGCGKSLFAIALALCTSTGTPFYGHEVRQGPVIFIAGEGRNGLKRRMMAWSINNMVSHDTAPLFISLMPAALTDAAMVEQVQAAIELVSVEHGPPVLIIIDTLARNFGPGDENSTQDMSKFVQAADALRASSQATVLIVHHSGHSEKGRARGAMALKGALDAEYRLDKDETGIVRLEATKMKEADKPAPLAFRIMRVDLSVFAEDGSTMGSAVLESTSYSPPPQKGKAGQGKHQINGLQILRDLLDEVRRKYTTEGKDPATARVSMDEWKQAMKADGIPYQRISDVVSSLQSSKMVTEGGGFISPL